MIYVTGDTHGDLRRFRSRGANKLKSGDILLICGDFGFLWDDSAAEKRTLRWIGKRKYLTLFLDGKHENYDLLKQYPETELFGGTAQQISGNLYHLKRGEIYEIEGKKIFTFGGGESTEKQFRMDEQCWWEDELPTHEEMVHAVDRLEAEDYKVDYIITHEAPPTARGLQHGLRDSTNFLDSFFDEITHNVTFQRWFFGSVHQNKMISQKLYALFDEIIPTEAATKKGK